MRKELRPFLALALPFVPQAAVAWDYEGHRAVNQIALAALPPDFPSFVRDPAVAERIAFLSGEPDRWRNSAENALHNCNKPEHYIDAEDPADAGLPLATLTPFRYVFIARYDKARRADPARFPPVAPEKNRDGVRDLCGLLPWAIIENYGRIEAVFSRLKTLARDRAPDEELAAARAAAAYLMGVMGHYVGDATQPLHTTKHHNGWSGPNPNRYTTSRKIHAWIDGGVFARASFDTGKLRAAARPPEKLPPPVASAPGGTPPLHSAILSWIGEQNRRVEPLYRLVRSNDLAIDATPTKRGEDFIGEQLLRGGRMLASLWLAAWQNAAPARPDPSAARHHRSVAAIALAALPDDFPAFARSRQAAALTDAFAALPALWRNSPVLPLRHAADPDGFFNTEDIAAAGLEFDTLTDLRNQHAARFDRGRSANAAAFPPDDSARDPARLQRLSGFLPWAIIEDFARLQSAVSSLRAYEENGGTAPEIANTRENISAFMGLLAHRVAAAALPLNLSRGNTPAQQAAADFSPWLPADTAARAVELARTLPPVRAYRLPRPVEKWNSPPRRSALFSVLLTWILRQHERVPELRALADAGAFPAGQPAAPEAAAFIDEQQRRAATLTASLWLTAFATAPEDTFLIRSLQARAAK